MVTERVRNCFDSHLHWMATGESVSRLSLQHLRGAEDIKSLIIEPHHFRGQWLIGFGWDQSRWVDKKYPSRLDLDLIFPDKPVALTRVDGHALWVNTKALQEIGWLDHRGRLKVELSKISGGHVVNDELGVPTGILIDLAMQPILSQIPKPEPSDVYKHLLAGARHLNECGITHIRDMTCSLDQWTQSLFLEQNGKLTLAVEQYFHANGPQDLAQAMELAIYAKTCPTRWLRPTGIKVYYDGALGSEGALLSRPYRGCCGTNHGLSLMSEIELKEVMIRVWNSNLDLAVHAIGDEAAHQVMTTANSVWDSGINGVLHIEHAELLRLETLSLMRGRKVICHMQPCHWLTDRIWAREKLGPLTDYLFRWRALEDQGIKFDFGSDSPIEPASIKNNMEAMLDASGFGIPPVRRRSVDYQSHADQFWPIDTFTEFVDWSPVRTVFEGREVYRRSS